MGRGWLVLWPLVMIFPVMNTRLCCVQERGITWLHSLPLLRPLCNGFTLLGCLLLQVQVGDFVNVTSGAEVPYVAQVANLREDIRTGGKEFEAKWLWRQVGAGMGV